jgi:hypothetical protein
MASPALREAGISVMMRPWADEAEALARPSASPASASSRFWRALAQFIFDYNRY